MFFKKWMNKSAAVGSQGEVPLPSERQTGAGWSSRASCRATKWKWKWLRCVRVLGPPGRHSPRNSPGQHTGVGSPSPLQGVFPPQGSNPGLPHCRQIFYQLSHRDPGSNVPHCSTPFLWNSRCGKVTVMGTEHSGQGLAWRKSWPLTVRGAGGSPATCWVSPAPSWCRR